MFLIFLNFYSLPNFLKMIIYEKKTFKQKFTINKFFAFVHVYTSDKLLNKRHTTQTLKRGKPELNV